MRVTTWLSLVLCGASAAYAEPETTFELPNGATMYFVWIEPRTFVMGSPESERQREPWEGPQHQVTLTTGFWLGKYEVTPAQWEAVMGTTPWVGREQADPDPQRPAAFISWNDVQAMVQRLNEAVGEQVYRLPTSAEWEYACRAGTTTAWYVGDSDVLLFRYAWYYWNTWEIGACYTRPVGTLVPDPCGLHSMHGYQMERPRLGQMSCTAVGGQWFAANPLSDEVLAWLHSSSHRQPTPADPRADGSGPPLQQCSAPASRLRHRHLASRGTSPSPGTPRDGLPPWRLPEAAAACTCGRCVRRRPTAVGSCTRPGTRSASGRPSS